jgi:hypothetical protein
VVWGDTTSSVATNGSLLLHVYSRGSSDRTFTPTLTLDVEGTTCLASASTSVEKLPAKCPTGKAVVVNPTITIEGLMARASFSIAGGCSGIDVSLATYTAPSVTIAYPQYLFDSDHSPMSPPQKFNAGGPYTLSARLPDCFWQADLVLGQVIETLTVDHLYGSRTLVFRNGGSTSCLAR